VLTRRIQIQAIADFLAEPGQHNGRLSPEEFDEPWREVYQAILAATPGKERDALTASVKGLQDADNILGAILGAQPFHRPQYQSLDELGLSLRPIEWLWPGWIPKGMLTLFGSPPGGGKSYVALDICRRIIEGSSFPDGSPVGNPDRPVIYVDAEVVPQLINERAQAWEMDCSRLYLMYPKVGEMLDLTQTEWQDHLIEMVHSLNPTLIVIDSLSTISSKGENAIEDVRALLGFLNALAVDFNCGLLLIHHLRKRGPMPLADELTIDDFRGSSHIIAMARSVLGLSIVQVGPEPDRNGPRRLEIIKTNLGRYPDPIGIEFRPLEPKGVLLSYGEPPKEYEEPTKLDSCVEWLRETLKAAEEPVKPRELMELAEQDEFSRSLVYRARDKLGPEICDTNGRRNPGNCWVWHEWADEEGVNCLKS
jgi:hypothetical protein